MNIIVHSYLVKSGTIFLQNTVSNPASDATVLSPNFFSSSALGTKDGRESNTINPTSPVSPGSSPIPVPNPTVAPNSAKPAPKDDGLGFDVDELVRKIDAKIAELEEEEKRNKYNANNLFKSKIEINQNKKNGKELIEYKESIFKKLIKMIKKLKRR